MPLIATWHPTYAFFRNPWEMGAFECDLARFARVIKKTTRPKPKRLVTNPTAADVRKLALEGTVAVDIETKPQRPSEPWTGKDPTRAKLKTIGLGCTTWALSFVWRGNGSPLEAAVVALLEDERITKLTHNGQWFDHRVLKRYGIRIKNWLDTRDLRRALSSTSPLSLRHLGSIYDDCEPWKEGDEDDEKGLVFTEDLEKLKRYNAFDCVVTARAAEAMIAEPEWKEPRVQKLYDVHKRVSSIAAEMHDVGIYVNQSHRAFMTWCLEQEYDEKERIFLQRVGIRDMRCTPNDLRSLIYRRHATKKVSRFNLPDPVDPKMYTDETMESISVDESSLLLLLTSGEAPDELIPILDAYWEAESAWKRRSFLASQYVTQAIGPDGRLRPGWNSCGTDTMRFSCSQPNVMNIEQDLRAYLGPAPGMVQVHADKSQLELRVMAVVADDPVLQGRLDNGDVYTEDTKDWFGLPKHMTKCECSGTCEQPTKHVKSKARKASKIIHLGSQYAAGVPTIWAQFLRQDRTAKYDTTRALHNGFKKTYERTVSYWFEEMARVSKCGYSEGRLLFGRRNYPRPPPITEVANYPIQRTAGEMMQLEIIRLHAALKKRVPRARLQIQLHDAFDVEAPEKDEQKVIEVMEEVMDRSYTVDGRKRRFPVEIKVARYSEGQTWASV